MLVSSLAMTDDDKGRNLAVSGWTWKERDFTHHKLPTHLDTGATCTTYVYASPKAGYCAGGVAEGL